MEDILSPVEQRSESRGRMAGALTLLGLIILLFIPLFFHLNPPPGQEGILVNLGLPDMGQGEENAGPSLPAAAPSAPEQQPDPEPEPVVEPQSAPAQTKPQPVQRDVIQTEDPAKVALEKRREQERREQAEANRQAQADAERKRQQQLEAQRQADAERKRQADADAKRQAEADATKNQIGGLFGTGSGKGNTGTAGNQGDPNGDPNASNLEGISTGSGRIGGGLGGRGVLSSPSVSENSQKQGTVVISLCVGPDGSLIGDPSYTQRGSTTSDAALVRAAINNAKRWRFSAASGAPDRQCGTITYNFKLQ
jgi:outer membrane biosynthesis protein TonB